MTNNTFRTKNGIEVLGNSRIYGSAIFGGPREFQFDPASLFANGEVGHWPAGYDPAAGRVFQLSDGTSPATAAAQSLGLALDKSQGLALGPELVTNPSGTVFRDALGSTSYESGAFLTAGKTYLISFAISNNTSTVSSSWRVAGGGGNIATAPFVQQGHNGQFQIRVAPTGSGLLTLNGNSAFVSLTISGVSVRELPGNHAAQATSLSRPTLSRVPRGGRRNKLTFAADFANVAWAKLSCNFSAGVVTTTSTGDAVSQAIANYSANATHATTFRVAAGTATYLRLVVYQTAAATNRVSGWFNLASGAVESATNGGTGTGALLTFVEVSPGVYDVTLSGAVGNGATSVTVQISTANAVGSTTGVSGATYGIVRAQTELGSTATPFQDVQTARDVTETGVPNVWHLNDDGNDSLPVALPAGTYTAAWVNALGAVTIAGGLTVTTTLDTLRGQNQADALIINRALGEAERVALTRYWQARYASI
jgi:hypothetical protein